jgi:hypothetical protein
MITRAFITKRNNPNVRIVMGKVNRISSGFKKVSSKASTKAKTRAVA